MINSVIIHQQIYKISDTHQASQNFNHLKFSFEQLDLFMESKKRIISGKSGFNKAVSLLATEFTLWYK